MEKFIKTKHVEGQGNDSDDYEESLNKENSDGLDTDEDSEPSKRKKKTPKRKASRTQLQKGSTKASLGNPSEYDDELNVSDDDMDMDMEDRDIVAKTIFSNRQRKKGKPKKPLMKKRKESSFENEDEEGEEMEIEGDEEVIIKRKTPKRKEK